jgi:hypothetical protein
MNHFTDLPVLPGDNGPLAVKAKSKIKRFGKGRGKGGKSAPEVLDPPPPLPDGNGGASSSSSARYDAELKDIDLREQQTRMCKNMV